jgi:hypothetical protein
MSWVAVGTVAVGAIAGGAQAYSGAQAGEDAQRAEYYANAAMMQKFRKTRDLLLKGEYLGQFGLEDVFGSRPEAALYEPIDVETQVLDNALGNANAADEVASLVSGTNAINRGADLERISALLPEFRDTLSSYEGATRDLIEGRLPFEDVLGIVSNQAELGNALGTPGTRTNATLKDLGIARMDATKQGGQLWQSLLGSLATSVNPISSQFLAQGSYLTPQNYLSTALAQAGLSQQSQQSANFLAASPDPGVANLFNTEFGIQQRLAGVQGQAAGSPSTGSQVGMGAGMGALNGLLNYFSGGLGGSFNSTSGGNVTGSNTISARPY